MLCRKDEDFLRSRTLFCSNCFSKKDPLSSCRPPSEKSKVDGCEIYCIWFVMTRILLLIKADCFVVLVF